MLRSSARCENVTACTEKNISMSEKVNIYEAGLKGRCPRCGKGKLLKGYLGSDLSVMNVVFHTRSQIRTMGPLYL
jgi:uncharacterized protein (DUF983 family)